MILEDATHEAFGYYPSALKPQSVKKILVVCDGCGKLRVIRKDAYHTLCRSCAKIGEKHHNYGKSMSREQKHKLSEAIKGNKSAWWKGGPIKRVCKICSKIFYVYPYRVNAGGGKYCSYSCKVKAQRHNARPTKTVPERIFEAICKKHQLPFKFVGDGSLWLGNANPDFVHNTKKIAVEVFGDYWHSPLINRNVREVQTVEGRTAQLTAEGYTTIILWESDLKRVDAEEFILHEMQSGGII